MSVEVALQRAFEPAVCAEGGEIRQRWGEEKWGGKREREGRENRRL